MTRVLVTGGSGRLGRSVVGVLASAGHDVVSVDRDQSIALSVRQRVVDLRDPEAAHRVFDEERPDAVVHLAAISVPFSRPDAEIYAVNTALAFTVMEATVASRANALLVASSPTVIGYNGPSGWRPHYLPLDEEHPVAPWNGYSLSKDAIERLIGVGVRAHGDHVRFGVFRPCFVVAPEEWLGAPTQQGHTISERLDNPALSAVALFNYLDARDAGDFVDRWLRRADMVPNGSSFFVGASDSLVREPVGEAIARFVPQAAAAAAHLALDAPLFSTAKAEALLGWRPQRSWRTELTTSQPEEAGVA